MMTRKILLPKRTAPRSELACFLRALRQSIDPNVLNLGPYQRHPSRIGRRVTQEELAEAIGVTREWYATHESAIATRSPTRPSQAVLERLAEVLMITQPQRKTLFEMAVPQEWRVHLSDDSISALEAFSRLRSFARRLWTSTSVEDGLAMAAEEISGWFDPLLVYVARRRDPGVWESQATADKPDGSMVSKFIKEFQDLASSSPAMVDALNLYPQLRNAGEVGSDGFHPPRLQQMMAKYQDRCRNRSFTFLKARICTRRGLIASVGVFHDVGHAYSPSDYAALAACAQVASLALS
jgi:transcriptional regulator with XRE-family HTH domain